jgi:3-hydroxyacyl-[acyl-carrier-protein] dehydratase
LKKRRPDALDLGPDVLRILLPHRRPFLMVDRITAYAPDKAPPTLRAVRHISANEPVFTGHFPELSIWPGVYTQEGLGQSCNLLVVLLELQRANKAQGTDPQGVLDALSNMELGHRLHPGFKPELAEQLLSWLPGSSEFIGFTAAVDLKFMAPVFAGQRLDYLVQLTHRLDDMVRCDVEAQVEGAPVVRGTITGKLGIDLPVLRLER